MQPEINVLGLSIKTFGLFFALNFVAWGALVGRRLRELGQPVDWAYEMVAAALVGGLIGARGYWLAQNHESFSLGSVLDHTKTNRIDAAVVGLIQLVKLLLLFIAKRFSSR